MRKAIGFFIVLGLAWMAAGCMSGPPVLDDFEDDMGIVEPVVMFGEPTDGQHNSAAFKFGQPKTIAVDAAGNIIVGSETFDLSVFSSEGQFICLIGSRGEGEGQWMYPKGIAVDKQGRVYVADNARYKVLIFDKDFNFIEEFGKRGEGPGEFNDIAEVDIDEQGNIYVSDDGRGIHVFGPDLDYIKTIYDPSQTEENGYIAVNSKLKKIYVAEDGNGQVDVYDIETGDFLYDFGGLGPNPENLAEDVEGLAIGPWDLVFVVDEGRVSIKIYQEDGTFVTQFGKKGLYTGEMASSEGVAYDSKNRRVVLADEKNNRIQAFSLKDLGF